MALITRNRGIAILAAGVLALALVLVHAVSTPVSVPRAASGHTPRRIEHAPADAPWGHDALRAPPKRVKRAAAATMPRVSKPLATLRDLPPPDEHADPPALPPEAVALPARRAR
jgi:hypothetical protein